MTPKLNCWQFKNCGRESGGLLAETLGVCPVAAQLEHDGVNDGVASGRVCWTVARTAAFFDNFQGCSLKCQECEFYRRVLFEEADAVSCQFSSILD